MMTCGTITLIERAKKRKEHVNIFLDDKYWINVHEQLIITHNLYKDKILTTEEKQVVEAANHDLRLHERLYRYLLRRPHSIGEITNYLRYRIQLDDPQIDELLIKFKAEGFLSDKNFTRWFIQSKKGKSNYGEQKVRAELLKRAVPKSIIDQIMAEQYDASARKADLEKIKAYISQHRDQIKAKDDYERRQKLIQRLLARGFKYEDVKKALL